MTTLWHDLLNLLGSSLAALYNVIPNYGVAIILLTIAVRLILLPLTIKQTRSMQEMTKLQPELKRLQAKYKGGDKQKLNEEMMKLYKEHQVNPLGGCLPLLLQLPIFWALYRVLDGCGKTVAHSKACAAGFVGVKYLPMGSKLRAVIRAATPKHLGHAGFLGMNLGISPVDFVKTSGVVHAIPYIILVFLMVATTWYQQKQMTAVSSGQAANPQMQMMGKVMPVVLGVFSLELAAGVSIYWVASNIWTIVQQYFVLGKPALVTAGVGGAPAETPGKKGGDTGGSGGSGGSGGGRAKPALEKGGRPGQGKPAGKPVTTAAAAKAGSGRSQGNGKASGNQAAQGQASGGKPQASGGKPKAPAAPAKPSGGGAGKPSGGGAGKPSNGKPAGDKVPGNGAVESKPAPKQDSTPKVAAENGTTGAAEGTGGVEVPTGENGARPGGSGSSRPRPQRAPASDRKRNRR